jgi:hypothetical protein
MKFVLDVFKNRPGKMVGSIIVIVISLVTLIMFQNLKVETINEFFKIISNGKDNSDLFLTWGLNLFSFTFHVLMGLLWIKDAVRGNYMDISPEIGRVISFIVGILHLAFSFLFIGYVFLNLLGIVAVVLIAFAILGSTSKK